MIQSVASLISNKPAAQVENAGGSGPVVLICEHAGQLIPSIIDSFGIDASLMSSHIAWDIGAADTAKALSAKLDAPLVLQRYSRLAYDCNRSFDAADAMVEESDDISVPGNVGLGPEDRCKRYDLIYTPFENAIRDLLDARLARNQETILVTIHSFTPIYKGRARKIDLGVLHDSDSRLADALLQQTERQTDYNAARNEPYSPQDGVTHTLITHGIQRGLANVMLEIRNDLIDHHPGQNIWSERISGLLNNAIQTYRN